MERGEQMNTFICPECGKVAQQSTSRNRQYCPECAEKRRLERGRISSRERLELEKESNAIKAAAKQTEKREFLEEHRKADAELDAKSAKQRKQCVKCKYQLRQGSNNVMYCIGCDYISWEKHSRDKGDGPGKCGSFVPLTKETRVERIARRRRSLLEGEANNAHNTGEKMREVN